MNPIGKALWLIESQLASELSLDGIAQFSGLSRFSLARLFGFSTGYSVMRYIRARRLSEAARALAAGSASTQSILDLALGAGYGSHEAFTRAFREHFDLTPEALRAQGNLDTLRLVEPFNLERRPPVALPPPRLEHLGALLIGGLGERLSYGTRQNIPRLWQRFTPRIGAVPNRVDGCVYGVCSERDDEGGFDYLAGIEVSRLEGLPASWQRLKVPAGRYAVFQHPGHIAELRDSIEHIWQHWLPQSGYPVGDRPELVRCSEDFDPVGGRGQVEFCLPIEA
ncbi:MAG: AraC family transcriptional regulator [Pseudomonas sp.]|uniref:GyrI-like domain-containing protein n=1 Tax=Pseudomonas sp. TaxID=306 RepID=UPI003394BDB4